jgi:uncharacterized protein with HEPN domain
MLTPRARQRLISHIHRDIGQIEAYLAGITQIQFITDALRRDAVERCMLRLAATANCLPPDDRALTPTLTLLRFAGFSRAIDRLDSDLIWGLARQLGQRATAPEPAPMRGAV